MPWWDKTKRKEHRLRDSRADDEWTLTLAFKAHAIQTMIVKGCSEMRSFLKKIPSDVFMKAIHFAQ